MDEKNLERLRAKYLPDEEGQTFDESFRRVAENVFSTGTRSTPYSGLPTLLAAPHLAEGIDDDGFKDLDVALVGVPMDLGASNRGGARFGPRALRTIERIGPYNHALDCSPLAELKVADVGDVPFQSRFSLEGCHSDIEAYFRRMVQAGVVPLAVGGDHSITQGILRAVGAKEPVGLVHFDAHCDTGGKYDGSRFHHGGPFRNAVLDGVIDPHRTIQIGIRGSSEYLWEFSADSGMTVVHCEDLAARGCDAVIEQARKVVGDGPVYVTFDVDALDPVFAPGTGTPEIGGMTTREAQMLLRGLKGLNVIGGDVMEVSPEYDSTTNTAQAGAQLLFEILSLMVFSPSIGRRAP